MSEADVRVLMNRTQQEIHNSNIKCVKVSIDCITGKRINTPIYEL